jgi:hypothetical protein
MNFQRKNSLLDLPLEIRLDIYVLVFEGCAATLHCQPRQRLISVRFKNNAHSLLLVNRALYLEAIELYYCALSLSIEGDRVATNLLSLRKTRNRSFSSLYGFDVPRRNKGRWKLHMHFRNSLQCQSISVRNLTPKHTKSICRLLPSLRQIAYFISNSNDIEILLNQKHNDPLNYVSDFMWEKYSRKFKDILRLKNIDLTIQGHFTIVFHSRNGLLLRKVSGGKLGHISL